MSDEKGAASAAPSLLHRTEPREVGMNESEKVKVDHRGSVHVGTVTCPRCRKDLTIAVQASATVSLTKPPRKRKVRCD